MNMCGNAEIGVPPGFRFHPTDEELVCYYLRKKVSYEAIDLDVITEVDLNKLEPWDLQDKCRIGSGPHNEWYFFSHKDKKYPTGTRTNRATTAGFWKATGRDKAIHHTNSKRIGMRKTLVFYTGRAPHGQKSDWIMHEYRLNDDNSNLDIQEDGWVVCRVFKKKSHININRGFQQEVEEQLLNHDQDDHHRNHGSAAPLVLMNLHHHYSKQNQYHHLPQLFSPESAAAVAPPPSFAAPAPHHMAPPYPMELHRPHNALQQQHGDWSCLDKLPFQYLGCDTHVFNFSK